jgi:signal transduction histidine kinase
MILVLSPAILRISVKRSGQEPSQPIVTGDIMFLNLRSMSGSLSRRITFFSSLGIVFLVGVIGVLVVWTFNKSTERSIYYQLAAFNDLLIASTEVKQAHVLVKNTDLLATLPRYWQVMRKDEVIAKSPLLKGKMPRGNNDKDSFLFIDDDGTEVLMATTVVRFPNKVKITYAFGIQKEIISAFVQAERHQFYLQLAMVTFFILPVLLLFIRVQLKIMLEPLQQIQTRLKAVQFGDSKRLDGDFPDEIRPLTDQINTLLDYSEQVIGRYRTFASNLSHALKTPLSALLNESSKGRSVLATMVKERVGVMQGLIDRNLARVKISGSVDILHSKCDLIPIIKRISTSFGKLYSKQVEVACEGPHVYFKGDENDAYELFGNIIENACKYTHHYVQVSVSYEGNQVVVVVEDDGSGIADSQRQEVLKRGKRLDESKPGEGIGLSVVQDIVALYGGTIMLGNASLGGLKVTVHLPAIAPR